MSSKLDQSLDEILAERPRGGARRGGRGGASAPASGIRKRSQRAAAQKANVAVTQNATKAATNVPTGPSGKVSGSKIIVSNLPFDVSEAMIKEYFTKVVGPIKRCVITYGPNGQSRGIATVEFSRPQDAATAVQKYNGVEVDKRPMKVELVIDPTAAPPTSFADRVGAPKPVPAPAKTVNSNKPKPVTSAKAPRGAKGRRGRGGRNGAGREKKKTADELDAEMADYFESGSAANNQAGAAPAATAAAPAATNGGDIGMDDDVL